MGTESQRQAYRLLSPTRCLSPSCVSAIQVFTRVTLHPANMAMASAQLSGVRVVAPTRVVARRSTAGPVQATLRQDVARVAKAAGERAGQ